MVIVKSESALHSLHRI